MDGAASFITHLENKSVPRDSPMLDDVEVEERKKDATLHPWMKFEIVDLRSLGKGNVIREGEDLTEKEEAILHVIMEYCLEAVFTKTKFESEAKGVGKFCDWVHPDDIAFCVLTMQHYFNKWMIIAMREYRLDRKLTEVEMDSIKSTVNDYGESRSGLSSTKGRVRYFELRSYTSELWKNQSCQDRMNEMFEIYNDERRMSGSDRDSTGRKGKRKQVDATENDEMGKHMMEDMKCMFGGDFAAV